MKDSDHSKFKKCLNKIKCTKKVLMAVKFTIQGLIIVVILPLLLIFGSVTYLFIGFTTLWMFIFLITVYYLLIQYNKSNKLLDRCNSSAYPHNVFLP